MVTQCGGYSSRRVAAMPSTSSKTLLTVADSLEKWARSMGNVVSEIDDMSKDMFETAKAI